MVVPVHNEDAILTEQVSGMVSALRAQRACFELLVVENGSTDQTPGLCQALSAGTPEVRVLHLPVGDYGRSLRQGILEARNDVVVIFNVEFWSIEFVRIAITALESRDIVIGSKSAPGAQDERPWLRRLVTQAYNLLLRSGWGLDGTDTHGMKAFWRVSLSPLVQACVTDGFVFDTELVLRAQRAGLSKLELPTDVREVRPPSGMALARRVPSVLRNLWVLCRAMPPRPWPASRRGVV